MKCITVSPKYSNQILHSIWNKRGSHTLSVERHIRIYIRKLNDKRIQFDSAFDFYQKLEQQNLLKEFFYKLRHQPRYFGINKK